MRKIVLIILAAVLLILVLVFVYFRFFMKNVIWDGPGSVYTWTDYELYSEWVEIGVPDGREPVRLNFSADRFTMIASGTEKTFRYSLLEGTNVSGIPAGEVYLYLQDCDEFEHLIFHEENIGEERVPVLSGTIFEQDGRGEIVIAEYVRRDDLERLPDGFRSMTCIERNDRVVVPMIKTPEETTSK